MPLLSFRDWLLSTPHGAGEIWDNGSNADRNFGVTGARSKTVSNNGPERDQSGFDPDKLFLGKSKKKSCKKVDTDETILGGNHGSS